MNKVCVSKCFKLKLMSFFGKYCELLFIWIVYSITENIYSLKPQKCSVLTTKPKCIIKRILSYCDDIIIITFINLYLFYYLFF